MDLIKLKSWVVPCVANSVMRVVTQLKVLARHCTMAVVVEGGPVVGVGEIEMDKECNEQWGLRRCSWESVNQLWSC